MVLSNNIKTIKGIINVFQNEGRLVKKERGGIRRKALTDENKINIKRWVEEDCSLILKSIQKLALSKLNVSVSQSTINMS